MQNPVESFRISFWRVTGYVVAVATVTSIPTILLMLMKVRTLPLYIQLSEVAIVVAGIEVLSFLSAFAVVAYFKVYVSPDGLRAYNSWGIYRESAWADIRSARPVNMLGLKSLRVFTAGSNTPLWLPLFFLNDLERFYRLVRQYAGPEHPLAVALHNEIA